MLGQSRVSDGIARICTEKYLILCTCSMSLNVGVIGCFLKFLVCLLNGTLAIFITRFWINKWRTFMSYKRIVMPHQENLMTFVEIMTVLCEAMKWVKEMQ